MTIARQHRLASLVAAAVLVASAGQVAAQGPSPTGAALGSLDDAVRWLENHGFAVSEPSTIDGRTLVTASRAATAPPDRDTICRLIASSSGVTAASLELDLSAPAAGDLLVAWVEDFAPSGLGFVAWGLGAGSSGSEPRVVDLGDRWLSVSTSAAGPAVRASIVVSVRDMPAPFATPGPSGPVSSARPA